MSNGHGLDNIDPRYVDATRASYTQVLKVGAGLVADFEDLVTVVNPSGTTGNNGDYYKALEYYQQALDLNSRMPQTLNNMAVIYHYQGTKASENKEFELAQNSFEKAGSYWKKVIRLAPNNYIEAQNWLKITGQLNENDTW